MVIPNSSARLSKTAFKISKSLINVNLTADPDWSAGGRPSSIQALTFKSVNLRVTFYVNSSQGSSVKSQWAAATLQEAQQNKSPYLSRWDMTVFETSAPASCRMRIIWKGESLFLPGWMITGHPSCDWACAVAWSTLCSLGVKGQEHPISPTTPHLILVPSAPLSISSTIISVS